MKILVFSSLNIDHDYTVDHICRPRESMFADSYKVVPGGKGLNAAIALARSSVQVYLAGNIGNDAAILEKTLADNNVDIRYLHHVDEPNGHAIIQIDSTGENAIFVYGGSNQSISRDHIDHVLESFGKGDLIILQNEISNNDYLMIKAHEKGLTIMMNPSPINDALFSCPLELADYFFINEAEGTALTGKTDFPDILDQLKLRYPQAAVILTVGARGSYYQDSSCRLFQPACQVNAVDTVGAGDTFMGYFAYGLSTGKSPAECLKLATLASAITVTRKGAADAIPTLWEVTALENKLQKEV